jgi:formylglycine-generating enzyme required for sulfatase activity
LATGLYLGMKPKAFPMTLSTPTGEMVLVPAGDFLFGEKKEKISLPAFYIDKTEVTNKAYRQFCSETNRGLPGDFPTDKPDYPVVNVSILDAQAFANWAQKRLPTAAQWEKAARGTDGRIYPWGDRADPALANVGTGVVQSVSSLPGGASPFGALNMVGNAWELIGELREPSAAALKNFAFLDPPARPDEPWYTMRGQSFGQAEKLDPKVLSDAASVPARHKDPNIGFRCVQDPK